MHVLASGDLHIDSDGPRSKECARILDWINHQIETLRPCAYLCTGDVYHSASTPADRLLAAEHFTRAAKVCPVFIARGNHDKLSDLEIIGRLQTHHRITVEEGASVHYIGGAHIAIMAWPNRASLSSMLGRPVGSEGLDDAARVAMREVLSGFADSWRGSLMPKILLGHFMCDGSVTSTGQPLIGAELSVGTADLDLAGADVVIMGHIHKPQEFDAGTKCPKYYCGSPYRTAFGETEEKSVLFVSFDPRGMSVKRIPTPCTEMILCDLTWDRGKLSEPFDGWDGRGCEVRLRYTVPSDCREQARAQAEVFRMRMMLRGARSVKLDERVETTSRAREGANEVAQAVSLQDKLDGYWLMRGDVPATERRAALIQKVNELKEVEQ
jgi:DNA repair protein SbcD/Mre11